MVPFPLLAFLQHNEHRASDLHNLLSHLYSIASFLRSRNGRINPSIRTNLNSGNMRIHFPKHAYSSSEQRRDFLLFQRHHDKLQRERLLHRPAGLKPSEHGSWIAQYKQSIVHCNSSPHAQDVHGY